MNTKVLLITSLVSLAITACGGGSGSGDPVVSGDTVGSDVPVNAETGDLKNSAIGAIGGSFDGSLNAVGKAINENSGFADTVNDVASGGSDQMGQDIPTDADIQGGVQNWLSVSLGTDESSDSTTTREGNVITVDPDERELCREDGVFDQASAEEYADCTAFFKDLTVQLVATSEEAGTLTYLYQQQRVISLGYAPNSESILLDLGGLQTAADGISAINDVEQMNSPVEMSGSFQFSATETNSAEGQEAGSISYAVADQILIVTLDDDGNRNSLSMQPGTLLSLSADAATGEGSMSFDLGAIAATAPTDSGLGTMNLGGFEGRANINPNDGVLVVREFGLSKGPFSLSINNEEVMRTTLENFGFSVTEATDMAPGELIIDGNMDLSVVLNQFGENEYAEGVIAMALDMMAPDGTSFSLAGNGATQLGGAGPFTVSFSQTPDIGTPAVKDVVVNSGECFTDLLGEFSVAPSTQQCL